MSKKVNPKYWFTVQWSSDWKSKHPWTVGGRSVSYIGKGEDGPLTAWVFGPIAFILMKMR